MTLKRKSAAYCDHANEMPTGASGDSCKCAPDCYCRRAGNCKAPSRAYVMSPRNVKKGEILFWQCWGDVAVRELHYGAPNSSGRVQVDHVTLGDVNGDDEYLVDFHEVLARCSPLVDEKRLSPVIHGQLADTIPQESPVAPDDESSTSCFRDDMKSEMNAAQYAARGYAVLDWLMGRACEHVNLDPITAALLIHETRFCGDDRLPNRERFLKKIEGMMTMRGTP